MYLYMYGCMYICIFVFVWVCVCVYVYVYEHCTPTIHDSSCHLLIWSQDYLLHIHKLVRLSDV